MVEGISFYTLSKARVLIIPCKADDFFYLYGYQMKLKKSRLVLLSNLEFNFSLFCGETLRKHYIIKATLSAI